MANETNNLKEELKQFYEDRFQNAILSDDFNSIKESKQEKSLIGVLKEIQDLK